MKLRPVLPTIRATTLLPRRSHPALLPFPLNEKRLSLWYLGRNALYAALGVMDVKPGDTVLVPSYTNGVEVAAIVARGLKVHTVPIKKDFTLDVKALDGALARTGAKVVLAIHYLGFAQPVDRILEVCRKHGAKLIEDCALSFLAKLPDGRPVGSVGDVALFSVYKTLPVPDGAALIINDPSIPDPQPPVEPEIASSISGLGRLVMQGAKMGGRAGQALAKVLDAARRGAGRAMEAKGVTRTAAGSMKFETKRLPWGASRFTREILRRLDYEQITFQRRKNFERLREKLGEVETFFKVLPDGACPLFYPVVVGDKQALMNDLAAKGIETVNFWSTWDPATPADEYPWIKNLREHVVELPCLQDLAESDMDVIAEAVLESLTRRGELVPKVRRPKQERPPVQPAEAVAPPAA